MLLIGLTGGIASGKSVVASRLAEHGARVVDADQVAREVVQPGEPALAQLAEAFGPGILADDGTLNRPALGALVFGDAEKLAVLNGITHPAIAARTQRLFAQAGPDEVVVYDVPLLVEAGRKDEFDLVVVVDARAETRIGRMMERRGMTREEALHRINSQATDSERLAIADVVIDSDGTLEHTLEQTDALWENLRARVGGTA